MEARRQAAVQRKAEEERMKTEEEGKKVREETEKRKREREELTGKRPLKVADKKVCDQICRCHECSVTHRSCVADC